MPLELIIQIFLITSFFVILVIVAKLYYKFAKNISFVKDSFLLALMSNAVLMFPVFANPESRFYVINHLVEMIIYLLLNIIALGILYYFLNRAVFRKELFLDSLFALLFKLPDIKACENLIKQKVPKTKTYNINEISKLIKVEPKIIEKALNKLALEKKIKISVIENGELQYIIE